MPISTRTKSISTNKIYNSNIITIYGNLFFMKTIVRIIFFLSSFKFFLTSFHMVFVYGLEVFNYKFYMKQSCFKQIQKVIFSVNYFSIDLDHRHWFTKKDSYHLVSKINNFTLTPQQQKDTHEIHLVCINCQIKAISESVKSWLINIIHVNFSDLLQLVTILYYFS